MNSNLWRSLTILMRMEIILKPADSEYLIQEARVFENLIQ